MAEIPPMSPPPQYAAYPRGGSGYGDAEKLQSLSDGYFGLNKVFGINIVLALVARGAQAAVTTVEQAWLVLGLTVLVVGIGVGFLTYPQNKKIGFGCGWQPSSPIVASILMGLNSALCCGIIGYVVVQQMAMKEMKKYGVKSGFFGAKKKDIDLLIAQLRQA